MRSDAHEADVDAIEFINGAKYKLCNQMRYHTNHFPYQTGVISSTNANYADVDNI